MIAFSIWSIDVYWYGIFYLISFLIWYFFLKWIGKTKIFAKLPKLQDLLQNHVDDLLIYIILWVLIGWRLWEVFIYEWAYFSKNLWQIFAVWNGGMSFIGWAIWVFLSLLIIKYKKKLSFVEFILLFDTLLVVVPLAIVLGRFWNYLNQEIYWLIVPEHFWGLNSSIINLLTSVNIFHVYDLVDNNLRINVNFVSILFEWSLLFLILWLTYYKSIKQKKIKPGLIVWLFLSFYSLFRFFIEYLRIDSQSHYVWIFTKSQRFFIAFIIVWLMFIFNNNFKKIKL